MRTASQKQIDYANPQADQIDLRDIALSLSQTCRFTGQCSPFYSVGQHSILLSYMVPPHLALQALMHDAGEAYCHDINTGLKALLPDYRAIYDRVEKVVFDRFSLPWPLNDEVHRADKLLGQMEFDAFMLGTGPLDRVFLANSLKAVPTFFQCGSIELTSRMLAHTVISYSMKRCEAVFEERFHYLVGSMAIDYAVQKFGAQS